MLVAEAVAQALAGLGADTVFGVVGSGNFHVTNGLTAHGVRYVAARHECGAASMADGWARLAGRPGLLSVHQGPGLTNALTGITEAAKSRTPLVVLAADVAGAAVRSNFRIDVAGLAAAVGAVPERLHSAQSAVADTVRAYQTAARQRRTVLLAMPLDVQAAECDPPGILPGVVPSAAVPPPAPSPDAAAALARALTEAGRPVFIAGRGARVAAARRDLEQLADACGALLATSAAAKGLFRGSPWDLDVSGGFATPAAAELISGADLVVAWGCSLNMWTTRHGTLLGAGCQLAQVDDDPAAIGGHRPVDLGVFGDAAVTARAVLTALRDGPPPVGGGYRSAEVRERIAREGRWRDVPYTDESGDGLIDPRTLSIELDDLLPAERVVAVDSGNFMGYPSMFLSVPDEQGFCFTQAYQSIGLGLASAIGSAVARPDRLTVATLGDGGALMGVSELETVVRLGLPMVVVVYDDEAYGAEVHHFQPGGSPLDTVRFPPTEIARIGQGFGFDGVTVRDRADLAQVSRWLAGPRERPLLIDAKVTASHGSWWLEEAFRGH
ncbi:MAG TPA: thiamine pyrophosphate-binding protein [Streptosporangiaceae bacterium]|jgi:thiamine pyrophosphate-dependent acetolactate synthase large subunit-like protein